MKSISLKSALAAGITAVTLSFAAPPASAMNQQELIEEMARGAGLSKADAQKALTAFVAATSKALKKGERVLVPGFGTFALSIRPARTARNPQTGQVVRVKAKKIVKFKPSSVLSRTVN